jgi:hypothetical protein
MLLCKDTLDQQNNAWAISPTQQLTAAAFLDPSHGVPTADPEHPLESHSISKLSSLDAKPAETTAVDGSALPAVRNAPAEHTPFNPLNSKFSEQITPPQSEATRTRAGSKAGHVRSGSASSENSVPKTVGFKDRIKGEVKVLSGKLTRNEAKVERGRAILAGEGDGSGSAH